MQNDEEGMIRIMCRKCETVFDVCAMPLDVTSLVRKIKKSKCPSCGKDGWNSYLYSGRKK